jgi:uncharacterized protein YkwD
MRVSIHKNSKQTLHVSRGRYPRFHFALAAVLSVAAVCGLVLTGAGEQSSWNADAEALGNVGAPVRSQYFAATGKVVKGDFLGMWEKYGLERIGYPLSDERLEHGRTVQYFERVRMEMHPDLAGHGYPVLMTRLGVDFTGASFARVSPFKSSTSRWYIAETGHSLADPFLSYWRNRGGVELYGYPISEPMQQDGLLVQWFERARMEYHPNLAKSGKSVQLTHLGKLAMERAGASGGAAAPPPPAARPSPSLNGSENYLLGRINEERSKMGLKPVQVDGAAIDLSRARSKDMADRNYFSHSTPEGTKFLDTLNSRNIPYKYAGEILARNNYPEAEAATVAMQSYLGSTPHRTVMLDARYGHVGIGHAFSPEDQMHYYTVIFLER